MRLVSALLLLVATALLLADPAAAQFTVGGDPRVNPNDFRITTFASGLNFPNGLARLSDGSILVATSNPNGHGTYWASSGELLRFTDADGNGIADGPGQLMYSDPVGVWVALKVAVRLHHQRPVQLRAHHDLADEQRAGVRVHVRRHAELHVPHGLGAPQLRARGAADTGGPAQHV